MTEVRNFLGIPIEGDIITDEGSKPQKSLEEFAPLLQTLIDHPLFLSCRWRQYTPYFNDGDPCVFSAYGFGLRVNLPGGGADPEAVSGYDESDDRHYYHQDGIPEVVGNRPYRWVSHERVFDDYVGEHEDLYDAARAVEAAIDEGEFLSVLMDLFGDHAMVTVRKDKIVVDEYSHD